MSELHGSLSSVTFQAGGWGVLGKHSVKASVSLSTLWTPPVGGDVSLESSKSSQTLNVSATCGKHNASLAAALRNVAEVRLGRDGVQCRCGKINYTDVCCPVFFVFFLKDLKKRQAVLKITVIKPNGPSAEVELEGVTEELRRDKKMYRKTAMLQLRSATVRLDLNNPVHVFLMHA